MAVSARSAAMRSPAGYAPRTASTTAFQPPQYRPPALPQVPTLARDASAPGYTERNWIQAQLGELPGVWNPRYSALRDRAKQQLAGYGGWNFRQDDPNTPEREDLILDFDAGMGLGEREKNAVRGVRNQSNAQGTLYSSFANQNVGQAIQNLSLEAQQVANQYAADLLGAQEAERAQYTDLVGRWTQLYGSDSSWQVDNPPPTPDPLAGLPQAADGSPLIWRGANYPNLDTLRARYPGQPLGVRQAGDGSYVVVIGTGAAKPPTPGSRRPANTNRSGGGLGGPDRPR